MPSQVEAILSSILQQNPDMANNQNAMAMVNAIRNNDQRTGEELANKILERAGVTREQGIQMATQKFGKLW